MVGKERDARPMPGPAMTELLGRHEYLPASTGSPRVTLAVTGIMVAVVFVITDRVLHQTSMVGEIGDVVIESAVMVVTTCTLLWFGVLRPLFREVGVERDRAAEREARLIAGAEEQDFEQQIQRALEMADTEAAVYRTVRKAMTVATAGRGAELLLADSSDAHLKPAVLVGDDEDRLHCSVETPQGCPAVRQARTLTFTSSEHIDACPHLEARPGGPCAATCTPVTMGGRSIGVIHAATDRGLSASPPEIRQLESIAALSGARIGMIRVMTSTSLQASTDPLTGLLNRRSFEDQAVNLLRSGRPFALAMCDLDHFKVVNDTNGHEAGDRALRVFANTLRSVLRSEDLICRYGGEEFVIVLPGLSADQATAVLHRVQEQLFVDLSEGTVPDFTASFGVTHTHDDLDLDDLCRVADNALFTAKRDGRNRVALDPITAGGAQP